jgi:hypothetical protein
MRNFQVRLIEGTKERRNEGTKERRNEGTKERRNEGTKERRNRRPGHEVIWSRILQFRVSRAHESEILGRDNWVLKTENNHMKYSIIRWPFEAFAAWLYLTIWLGKKWLLVEEFADWWKTGDRLVTFIWGKAHCSVFYTFGSDQRRNSFRNAHPSKWIARFIELRRSLSQALFGLCPNCSVHASESAFHSQRMQSQFLCSATCLVQVFSKLNAESRVEIWFWFSSMFFRQMRILLGSDVGLNNCHEVRIYMSTGPRKCKNSLFEPAWSVQTQAFEIQGKRFFRSIEFAIVKWGSIRTEVCQSVCDRRDEIIINWMV